MSPAERHLHVVRTSPTAGDEAPSELEDVGLTLAIFLVAAFPLASAMAGIGQWDPGSLGLGTLGVLLAGRELGASLIARCRSRRRP
jgi:hypothetical protein